MFPRLAFTERKWCPCWDAFPHSQAVETSPTLLLLQHLGLSHHCFTCCKGEKLKLISIADSLIAHTPAHITNTLIWSRKLPWAALHHFIFTCKQLSCSTSPPLRQYFGKHRCHLPLRMQAVYSHDAFQIQTVQGCQLHHTTCSEPAISPWRSLKSQPTAMRSKALV